MSATVKQLTPLESMDERISLHKDLTDIILGTDNVGAIANLVLDIVGRYTDAGKCSLMLLNDRRELSIVASRGIDLIVSREYRSKIGRGIAGTVVRNTIPVLVTDIDQDERFRGMGGGDYRTKSFISCPITGNKRMLGVLNASDCKDSRPLDEKAFNLMQIISQQAAAALENAYLVAQLREKAAELEDMNRKLMEADLLKTEFLTRISHELRTPLNSIKGSVYYLESTGKLTREEQKEFYSIISKESDKLSAIVENQLNFLACEDEMRNVKKSVISLAEILTEVSCSKVLSERFECSGVTLSVQMESGGMEILGDKHRISQIFLTLLDGLVTHLRRGDVLRISVREDDAITIAIQVNRELPERFLEHFSRPDNSFRKEGSGERVKMYLVRKAAEGLGWDLEMENRAGSFTLTLSIPRSRRQRIDASVNKGIELFLEFIAELMGLETCSIMLRDESTGELTIQGAMGLDEDIIRTTRIRPGDQICGWVALEGKPVLIEDIEHDPRFARKSISQYNTKSLLSVPLKIRDSVTGVLNLNNKKTAEPFTSQDLTLAAVLGSRVSHLIDKLREGESCEEGFREFTASFNKLLTAGRKYHKKARQIPDLVRKVMDRLPSTDTEKETALYVSMVYDLGLMFMDDAVLRKGKLELAEFASLKVHPFNTVELLNSIEFSPEVNRAILHHHEKFDGTGYPDGLAGNEIPLISRVIAVVDGYCAMVSKRPHRKEKTGHDALREISAGAGSSYDPAVVAALEGVLAVDG
jgi:response regulator RpfG family c-di-GMP phosphodiesterase/signal transduction histidine kinase